MSEKELAPHQQRVVEEKNELDKKANALSQFIGSTKRNYVAIFRDLGTAHRSVLRVR